MAKAQKNGKQSVEGQANQTGRPEKETTVASEFMHKLKDSLEDFAKISEDERNSLYGDQEFLDQFWEYFKKNKPDLLA